MMIVGQVSSKHEALMIKKIVQSSLVGKRARILGAQSKNFEKKEQQ